MTTTPCAFAACEEPGDHRVVVTAAEASGWALRPALLEAVDGDLASEGPRAAVGLMFCGEHAAGVEREHFHARAGGLTPNETRVLKHLQSQAAVGGDTIEGVWTALRISESGANTCIRRLIKAGVVVKSKYIGLNRAHRRVGKYAAVTDAHEPPPVQPTLGMDGEAQ